MEDETVGNLPPVSREKKLSRGVFSWLQIVALRRSTLEKKEKIQFLKKIKEILTWRK